MTAFRASLFALIVAAAPLGAETAAEAKPATAQLLWKLKGGGEVYGRLAKETPERVYIDIGPEIIDVPVSAIAERVDPSAANAAAEGSAGVGSGSFDPATGTVTFRNRGTGAKVMSQQEILEEVKKSVVLVSNPGGLGTGWIIDAEQGRLVTNHHVVGNEQYQTVTIFVKNGNQWDKKKVDNCSVEAFSNLFDIAIVKLDMDEVKKQNITLHPIEIGPRGSLEPGDKVFAVGNPGMGRMVLEHSISEGIVSSLARNFNDVIYLQTTAAVNPGNSGGPLVDERGQVVGLVTLKASFQEGVAFALPVDFIMNFLGYSNAYAVGDANKNQGFRYHRPQ